MSTPLPDFQLPAAVVEHAPLVAAPPSQGPFYSREHTFSPQLKGLNQGNARCSLVENGKNRMS